MGALTILSENKRKLLKNKTKNIGNNITITGRIKKKLSDVTQGLKINIVYKLLFDSRNFVMNS